MLNIDLMRKNTLDENWISYLKRLERLRKLKETIKKYEKDILESLKLDLGKSYVESYMSEVGVVLNELTYAISNLSKWMKPEKKKTPLMLFKAKSYVKYDPYGVVLILSPWNYPFQLAIMPLIGALAAGNSVVLKPSSQSVNTTNIIKIIIDEIFEDDEVVVILGDGAVADKLLDNKFDYIFFTGSIPVGKSVMKKAANHLTPVTLELGGKSPAIISEFKNIKLAAERIAFGKTLNAGQTCIAPDYLYIKEKDLKEFVKYYNEAIISFYGETTINNDSYPKIINKRHHDRLVSYINTHNVLYGGAINEEKISPTLIYPVQKDDLVMKEEIFGPILPIITYESLDEVIDEVNSKDLPLALYLFTDDKKEVDKVVNNTRFGGATINDTIMHFANHNIPFGGVSSSGMGKYHGKYSFLTFSNAKGIVDRSRKIDIKARYHPYNDKKEDILRALLK